MSAIVSSEVVKATVPGSSIASTVVADIADSSEATVFISYSRRDIAFVDRLDAALRARGVATLVDRAAIEIGEDWFARLKDLIARAETVVFVLSPDSINSEVCSKEVEYGNRLGKRFIPVVARRVDTPNVPGALSALNYVFLDDEGTYAENIDRLVAAIRTDLAWMRAHADLGRTAEEWNRAGRPRGLLLGKTRLQAAEHWIAHRPVNAPLPTDDTRALIAASRRLARQWRNGLIGALVFGLVLAIGLAGIAYWQQQIAERQTALATKREEEANREKDRAESTLNNAKGAADGLIFQIAQRLRGRGLPIEIVRDVLRQAETLMARLIESAPNDRALLRVQAAMYAEFAETYDAAGDADGQKDAGERSVAISRKLAETDPSNTRAQSDLAISLDRVGIAEETRGNYAAAQKIYNESLAIRRRLMEADPRATEIQRNLAVSLDRVGDIRAWLNDIDAAQKSYEESLAINRRLAEADPSSTEIQHNLAISLNKVGEVQVAKDDLTGAQKSHEESLTINRRLAEADPSNASAQRSLAGSLSWVGQVQVERDDLAAAQKTQEESLAISRRLAAADPSNASAQRDLSISLGKVGDVQVARDDLTAAQKSYDEKLAIHRRLAEADPSNARAQSDLSFSFMQVGEVQVAREDLTAAQKSYEGILVIHRRLAKAAPSDASALRNLVTALLRVGDIQIARDDLKAAQITYEEGLAVSQRMADANPSNASAQSDLSLVLFKLAALAHRADATETACSNLSKSRETLAAFRTRIGSPDTFASEMETLDKALSRFGCNGAR